MKPSVTGGAALEASLDAAAAPSPEASGVLPPELVEVLVRLRVLDGVPFEYLVPDSELLPEESIRFFHLDRNWTDALVQGVLSVGATTTRDRIDVATRWATVRDALDEAEHDARASIAALPPVAGDAEAVTGFVVRSRAISGWPGVAVRAYRRNAEETGGDPLSGLEELRLLRLERLAPAVLLALIDGVPDQVHLEEPRAGIQFGVDEEPSSSGARIQVALRHPGTGKRVQRSGKDVPVGVPFRSGSPGVVAVSDLVAALLEADGKAPASGRVLGGSVGPAELALQMLQLPYRQVFGEDDAPAEFGDVFSAHGELTLTKLAAAWRTS
jgi:hypothetical protein